MPSLTGGSVIAVLDGEKGTIRGSIDGRDVKEVTAVARPHGDPFYQDLTTPTLTCETAHPGC